MKVQFEGIIINGHFEELSKANRAYKAEVLHKKGAKTKKHLRLKFKAEFEECRETVGNLKNQKNKGYALELAILGAD